jgi:hypothetical protein
MTFGDLRSLLHQPPSPEAWSALCAAFDELDPRDHEPAASYAAQLLQTWPDPLRALPAHHIQGFVTDRLHPLYPLCRALTIAQPPRATLHALTTCANLAPLTHLALAHLPTVPEDDAALLPALLAHTRLHSLAIHASPLGSSAARAIAQAHTLDQLCALTLDDLRLGPDAARALASCTLPALRALHLIAQPLGRSGLNALMRWPALSQLTHLTLEGVGLDGELIPATASLSALRVLTLSGNRLGRVGLLRLRDAGALTHLADLQLAACSLNDEALRVLTTHAPSSLTALDLSHNAISDTGAQLLLDSALPTSLRLTLRNAHLSTEAQQRLAQRFPLAKLTPPPDHTPG